jgi:exo-beta-1,3-glucanase (GH17 family)
MHAPTSKPASRILLLLACILLAAGLNVLGWWWQNRPVPVSHDGLGAVPAEIASVSFAPFRRGQGPLNKVYPTPQQVEEDLASLQGIARGVRTYTAREGLEVVPKEAGRYGIVVMQGVWLGPELDINEAEVAAAIRLANEYPDTIKSLVVGNEVLLRKDLTVDQLIGYIRRIKAAVKQPVTYADVWEFWLRFPQLLNEVDFVTVHFLPYWEDMPVGVDHAMAHIMDVYRKVHEALPGKPVMIGEVGWPSQGRSRRAAIPSPVEAARFIADFLRLAEREKLQYNLVEAFDQPWKVALEGTVGGAWGVLDEFRQPKYHLDGSVSNLPQWPLVCGIALLAALILLIPQAPRIAALPAPRMLAAVLFVQMLGAFLAGTFEFGLAHNYSMLRFAEFVVMALLQALFAGVMVGELLDRLGRRPRAAVPLQPLAARLAEFRRLAPLWLPFGFHRAAPDLQVQFRLHRRALAGEMLFALFALLAIYQCLMLVVAGRYRDFPLDYFLMPVCGYVALRLLAAGFGGRERGSALLALGSGFAPSAQDGSGTAAGGCRLEAAMIFLLLALPVLVLLIETPANREAIYWCVTAAAYALPLLGNLLSPRPGLIIPA